MANTSNTSNTSNTTNPPPTTTPGTTTTGASHKPAYQSQSQSQYRSSDPSTDPSTSASEKLAGDVKGAAAGVAGGIQAATGTVLRSDGLAERGFEKMSREDARLAAKKGSMPVGAEGRSRVEKVEEVVGDGTAGGAGGAK